MTPPAPAAARDLGSRAAAALLVIVLVSGAALRLTHLDAVPPGVHTDEAHNALDAWAIAGGWRPAFLPGNNGREPLFMYLMAAFMAAVGPGITALRLTGAVAGIACIAAAFAAAVALPLARPRRVAVLTAAYLAATFWPVAQSRTAIRAGLLPVWTALLLMAWWRVIDPGDPGADVPGSSRRRLVRLAWAAAAGLAMGGALLTHLTGRILPVVVVVSAGLAAFRPAASGPRRRDLAAATLVALVVAGAVASPMLHYFAAQPAAFAERLSQVQLVGAQPVEDGGGGGEPKGGTGPADWVVAAAGSGARLAAAPLLRGDRLWYHNAKHRPIWTDWPSRLAFLAGIAILARMLGRRAPPRQRAAVILALLMLGATLAPSWLSVGAPNFFRMTGAWPILFLVPALGLDAGMALAERRLGGTGRGAAIALALAALGALTATTWRDYFGAYAHRPEVAAAFDADAGARGRQLAAAMAGGPIWVSPLVARQSILRLAALPRPLAAFDPSAGLVVPANGDGLYALDPLETGEAARLLATWPGLVREPRPAELPALGSVGSAAAEEGAAVDAGAGPVPAPLQVLHLPAAAAAQLGGRPVPGTPALGGALRLVRAGIAPAVVTPGGTVTVTLAFDVLAPTDRDLNLFIQATVGEHGVAQFDGPPLGDGDGTDRWRPGTRVVVARGLVVAADAPAGSATVRVGVYDWRDGSRLPVEGDEDAAIEVGAVRVADASRR